MKSNGAKAGFSLVELMVAALATAILILAVGSMLVFGWIGWKRNNDSVNMQRDASLAMRTMARAIRGSFSMTAGASLQCVNASNTVRFVKSGNNLDMQVDGNLQMHLIRDVVRGFSAELTTTGVVVKVSLAAGDDTATINETIYTRN